MRDWFQRLLVVGLLLGVWATGSPAAVGTQRHNAGSAVTTVLKLEDEWTKALIRHDVKAMAETLAEGMVYTENDQTTGRDALLRDLAASKEKFASAKNEHMKARDFGGTVVVTGWLVVKGDGPDGPFDRRYRFTDTWMKRSGRWRIVAAQDYLKPADE